MDLRTLGDMQDELRDVLKNVEYDRESIYECALNVDVSESELLFINDITILISNLYSDDIIGAMCHDYRNFCKTDLDYKNVIQALIEIINNMSINKESQKLTFLTKYLYFYRKRYDRYLDRDYVLLTIDDYIDNPFLLRENGEEYLLSIFDMIAALSVEYNVSIDWYYKEKLSAESLYIA